MAKAYAAARPPSLDTVEDCPPTSAAQRSPGGARSIVNLARLGSSGGGRRRRGAPGQSVAGAWPGGPLEGGAVRWPPHSWSGCRAAPTCRLTHRAPPSARQHVGPASLRAQHRRISIFRSSCTCAPARRLRRPPAAAASPPARVLVHPSLELFLAPVLPVLLQRPPRCTPTVTVTALSSLAAEVPPRRHRTRGKGPGPGQGRRHGPAPARPVGRQPGSALAPSRLAAQFSCSQVSLQSLTVSESVFFERHLGSYLSIH